MSELIFRRAQIDRTKADDKQRTVEASLSSEYLVERDFGQELLIHDSDAIDLSRAPLPLLTSHDHHQTPVGVVEGLRLVGKKLRGTLRFSERATELWDDVKAGILRNISIGYAILDGGFDQDGVYRATRWRPYEVSLVAIPADPTVGIGRSYQTFTGETMTTENVTAEPGKQTRSERRREASSTQRERERILSIRDLAKAYGKNSGSGSFEQALDRQAGEFIENGGTPEQLRHWIVDNMPQTQPVSVDHAIGMNNREADEYSFIRAIRAQIDPKFAMREAGLEVEASRAMAERIGKEPQGLYVPTDVLQRKPSDVLKRDLNIGTAAAGGNLVATDLLSGDYITLLRNQMAVYQAGARVISGLVGNVAIPRQSSGTTAYWVAEGIAPNESQPAFDQVALTPKTVGGYTDFTRKMILQATPDIEMLVRMDLAATVAQEIDRAALNGSGTGAEPLGVLNTTGIGSVTGGTDGAPPTWAHIVELEGALGSANADIGNLAYITNSKVRAKLKQTEKASGTAQFVWDGGLNNHTAIVSNQVPGNLTKGVGTNLSAILFGNWSDLLIGEWSVLDLLVDPYTFSNTGSVRVVAFQDVDIAVRHAESFAAMVDAVTA